MSLSKKQVEQIKQQYADGIHKTIISENFGNISRQTIDNIAKGIYRRYEDTDNDILRREIQRQLSVLFNKHTVENKPTPKKSLLSQVENTINRKPNK